MRLVNKTPSGLGGCRQTATKWRTGLHPIQTIKMPWDKYVDRLHVIARFYEQRFLRCKTFLMTLPLQNSWQQLLTLFRFWLLYKKQLFSKSNKNFSFSRKTVFGNYVHWKSFSFWYVEYQQGKLPLMLFSQLGKTPTGLTRGKFCLFAFTIGTFILSHNAIVSWN